MASLSTHFPFSARLKKHYWQDRFAKFPARIKASVETAMKNSITNSTIRWMRGCHKTAAEEARMRNFFKSLPDKSDRWCAREKTSGQEEFNPLYTDFCAKNHASKYASLYPFVDKEPDDINQLTPRQRWRYWYQLNFELLPWVLFGLLPSIFCVFSIAALGPALPVGLAVGLGLGVLFSPVITPLLGWALTKIINCYPFYHNLKYALMPFMAVAGAVATVGALLLDFVNAIFLGKLAKRCLTPGKSVDQTGDLVSETRRSSTASSVSNALGGGSSDPSKYLLAEPAFDFETDGGDATHSSHSSQTSSKAADDHARVEESDAASFVM